MAQLGGNAYNCGVEAERKKEIWKAILRLAIALVIIAAFVVGIYLLYHFLGWEERFKTREEFQAFVKGFGGWAPAIFMLIQFLQCTILPIPAMVTTIGGAILFGSGMCFLYSYIAIMAGSLVSFALGRLIGRRFVDWIVGNPEKVDKILFKIRGKTNVILFFAFFLPFFPDDILCAVAGITPIKWPSFIIMQLITRATSIGFTLLFVGGEVIPWSGWGIPVIIAIAVVSLAAFVLSIIFADKIQEKGAAFINKVFVKKKKETEQPVSEEPVEENGDQRS